jgi:hypothetical protein
VESAPPAEYPGPWRLPRTAPGALPMNSIASISPQPGQPAPATLLPRSQNAGQIPRPTGIFARISKRPYVASILPAVLRRAEV